jgi:hypothetical protein
MSFDPRSLERLRQLGRSLPQPLPEPPSRPGRPEPPRHPVETEQNPEQLFRELMQASADGNVPAHLLDRLQQLETQRRPPASASASTSAGASAAGAPRQRRSAQPGTAADSDLYTTFQQLLLEEEDA